MSEPKKINFIGRIGHIFTVNRSLSTLLLLAVLFLGVIAFFLTPKQYNPEIIRPAFLISLQYEGATIEQSRNRVVYELVEKINSIPGVDDVFTEVADGGEVETTVIFEVGYSATKAKLDLWSQLEQNDYLARGLISKPHIIEINPETIPVLQIVFSAETFTVARLREEVVNLTHTLSALPNVSALSVHGGYTSQLVVELNPEKLQAARISVAMVSETLAAAQVRSVHGGVTTDQYKIEAVFKSGVTGVKELGALLVTHDVRVRDVARVYEGVAGDQSTVWYSDGEQLGEVVVLAVSKVEGSSAPVVTSAVLSALEDKLQKDVSNQLSYKVVSDDGATASKEITGLTKNLLTSIIIVALVLMLFLSTRTALVVLVAIPITFLIVFGLGFLFDQTINRITLFALILSLGLLVDSAIVVVENIYAHLEEWKKGDRLVAKEKVIAWAVHEVGAGLLLSTLTSVIVFLPMAFITGMMGPYMAPIAFFVPAALIVSLLVAVTITPFVASRIIKEEEGRWVVGDWFAARLTALTKFYSRLLNTILSSRPNQRWVLRGALGLFLVSLILPITGLVHFQMLPKADRDQVYLYIDLPTDSNVSYTKKVASTVGGVVHQDVGVKNIQTYIAEPPVVDFNGMFKGAQGRSGDHQATMRINLVTSDDRKRSSSDITETIRQQLHLQIPNIAPHIRLMEEPPGPPVKATFVAKIQTSNQAVQEQVAETLFAALVEVDGVTDRFLSTDEPAVRTVYTLDNEAAHELGVSVESVEKALLLLTKPITVGEYRLSEHTEQTEVVVSLPESYRNSPLDIMNIMVANQDGVSVPLSAVLELASESRPSAQQLEGVAPVTYVTAEVSNRSIVYVMIDVMRLLGGGEVDDLEMIDWNLFSMSVLHKPSGAEVNIGWGGEWEMTLENFRDLGVAMGVALLLVYGVLVAQYNRFSTPAFILVTVPLGMVGILWGFFLLDSLANIYLTATALIGFIALIGLVVNNAIIFLEYVEQERKAGHDFKDSLINAGQARLRPILLTSLTTILGSLTIAGDPVWSGLAWAIIFGLSLSTILTLVIYPTLLMYYTGRYYE